MKTSRVPTLVTVSIALAAAGCSVAAAKTKTHQHASPSSTTVSVKQAPVTCPTEMVEVEGDYCPNVEEVCLRWVDIHGNTVKAPSDNSSGRCGEYQKPSRCLSSTRVHKHFCIDRFEEGLSPGQMPRSWMTYYDADRILKSENKRICTSSEWTFACEGPEMQPYPYGDGYHRDTTACNFDNPVPVGIDVFKSRRPGDEMSLKLDAMLKPAGAEPKCVSPFGVYQQIGGVDEWVVNETGHGHKSGLMGGHVFGVRSRCRALTDGHSPIFGWYETGFRGCKSL